MSQRKRENLFKKSLGCNFTNEKQISKRPFAVYLICETEKSFFTYDARTTFLSNGHILNCTWYVNIVGQVLRNCK